MKLLIAALFISLSSFAQSKDTTKPAVKDSVEIMPDKFKMDLPLQDVQILIDDLNKQIQALTEKRDAIIAQARKQIIKKPK